MSTFYLLPARPYLGQCFALFLEGLLPGVTLDSTAWPYLADEITALTAGCTDVFLVHREDLPAGEDPARALADGFGAEPGDEVIELRAATRVGDWQVVRWLIPAPRGTSAAA